MATNPEKNAVRKDDWNNVLTGLGGSGDKRKRTKMKRDAIILDQELESIYFSDGIGRKIITRRVDDMLREGWEIESEGYDEEDEKSPAAIVNSVLKSLNVESIVADAFYWKRLYGGAIIFIGALDGKELKEPLNVNTLRKIDKLTVIDRSDIEIQSSEFQNDPTKEGYGDPIRYFIWFTSSDGNRVSAMVHASRCITIKGLKVPSGATDTLNIDQRYWGLSVLQPVYRTLADLGGAFGSVGNLLHEITVGKYSLKDLLDILSQPDGAQLLKNRIAAMDMSKSVLNSIFLAEGETFTRDTINFAGVTDVMRQFMTLLAGASDYPLTVLYGTAPAGMNATGESDMIQYYDSVSAAQTTELLPVLGTLIDLICRWKKIEDKPEVEFNPLQQLTELEKAEVEKTEADTETAEATMYKTYVDMQALTGEEVRAIKWKEKLDSLDMDSNVLPPVEPVQAVGGAK